MEIIRINDRISVGGQPNEDDLARLAAQGYRTVVNFRADGEENNQWAPSEEGHAAEALGMKYCQLPTFAHALTSEPIDRFRAAEGSLPGPIYAHCTSGKRAAAIALAQLACTQSMTPADIEESARHWGVSGKPQLLTAVKNYAAAHSPKMQAG